MKRTRTRQTSSTDSSSDPIESMKRKDELMGKQKETASIKSPNQKLKGKCTMKKWESGLFKCSDKSSNYEKLRDKIIKREALKDSNMTNVESDANKPRSVSLLNGCGTGQKYSL